MAIELKKKQKNKFKKYTLIIWALFVFGVSSVFGIFYYASIGGLGDMPDLKVLENPKTNLASEILSEDGKTIAKFYFNDNRLNSTDTLSDLNSFNNFIFKPL